MTQQHCRITLEDAIARYQNRELTVKGLLRLYFEIKLKPGWEMKKSPKEIYEELGIGRTAFYGAFAALREEEVIVADDPDINRLSISRPIRECGQSSATADSESANANTQSAIADSESANANTQSAIAENESPKSPEQENFQDSSTYSSTYISNYSSNSLSGERERENALEVQKALNLEFFNAQDELTQQAILRTGYKWYLQNLKEYPTLPDRWIQCNAIEIAKSDFFVLEYQILMQANTSGDFSRGKVENCGGQDE
ncbi:MAG: hypothetical protein ACOC3E_01405 [Cyanobacteriota bacterium]